MFFFHIAGLNYFLFRVHLDELATSVSNHPVLKNLPLTVELEKRYNYALSVLSQYKSDIAEVWTHQNSWVIEDCLKRYVNLLQRETELINSILIPRRLTDQLVLFQ